MQQMAGLYLQVSTIALLLHSVQRFCSEDVDLEHDALRFRDLKRRLAAVVHKPVFVSRIQHLPSFKNGLLTAARC
jgi:hypothetical protein